MQITTSMIANQLLSSMQNEQTTESDLSQQLGTQNQILVPSDNVMGTVNCLDYQVSISNDGQYQANITNVTNNLNIANTDLTSLSSTLSSINSILTTVSSNNSSTDQSANSQQLTQLLNQMLSIANDKVGSNYIFAGFQSGTQPYNLNTTTGYYDYQGDSNVANVTIGNNYTMASNVPGTEAFSYKPTTYTTQISGGLQVSYSPDPALGSTGVQVVISNPTLPAGSQTVDSFSFSNVLDMTNILSQAIATNNTNRIQALVYPFSQMQNQVNTAQADVGSRLSALSAQTSNLTQDTSTLQDSVSAIQTPDTATIGVQLQQVNTALQALYSTSAQIIPESLFSFLSTSSSS